MEFEPKLQVVAQPCETSRWGMRGDYTGTEIRIYLPLSLTNQSQDLGPSAWITNAKSNACGTALPIDVLAGHYSVMIRTYPECVL